MAVKFSWRCPFCSHNSVIRDGDGGTYSSFRHEFSHENRYGYQAVKVKVIVCPNVDCREYTITVALHDHALVGASWTDVAPAKRTWRLIPESLAKIFPHYIPQQILDDYSEACLIVEHSPKASATLSRRCLQGMIRDFWQVSKARLADEIDAIKEKLDAETYAAIDSVRRIGNIGAHMERDINVIVDVDPEEAAILVGLIETLLTDWYIARHDRRERMTNLKVIAEAKDAAKKGGAV